MNGNRTRTDIAKNDIDLELGAEQIQFNNSRVCRQLQALLLYRATPGGIAAERAMCMALTLSSALKQFPRQKGNTNQNI